MLQDYIKFRVCPKLGQALLLVGAPISHEMGAFLMKGMIQ